MVLADARLPDVADAVRRARHIAVAALGDHDPALADAAALVVTELVTNAVLHGAPPVDLRLLEVSDGVRVEVKDASRRTPVVPRHSAEAMTGRGLSLVAALADSWGVDAADGGKVVWAQVLRTGLLDGVHRQAPLGLDVEALLDGRPDEGRRTTYTVRLGAVPTELLLQAKSHIDNVVREFTLARGEGATLPEPMATLIETVTRDFAGARAAIKKQALNAAERGEATTELVLDLPASAADAGARYLAALDEADTYARAARLLTLETPPDQRVFRRWYVQALVDQLRARARGDQPSPPPSLLQAMADEVRALSTLREGWERLRLLQKVTGELTGVNSVEDIAATVVDNACAFLGALSGRVLLLNDGVLRTVAPPGVPLPYGYSEVALDADLPGAVVARTRRPLALRNLGEIARHFPALATLYDRERSLHVAPLCIGDHCLGVFALTFPPDAQLDEHARSEFMTALADALAQALERTLAMEEAARANERLRFLSDAAVVLSRSLELRDTTTAVGKLLVPRLADWCVVQVLEDGQLRTLRAVHTDPAKSVWAERMAEIYPPRTEAPSVAANVVRTGRSELLPEIPGELLKAAAVDDEHLSILRSLGMSSALVVPLTGRRGTFGAVTLIYAESGRRYSEPDVAFAEDVAHRAALAIETARTFREQSGRLASVTRVAEAAQRAILAPPSPRVGGLALQARYISAAADALVGGDLYEVVIRPGAARLLIGDVKGKGLAAVRTATVVLGEFRAAAADLDDLAAVATQIDRRLRPYLTEEDFVTALLAEITDDGQCTVLSCGHPAPQLVLDGRLLALEVDATLPLGLGAQPTVVRCRLRRGDRVLMFTDGLVEARDPSGRFVDLPALVAPVVHGRLDVALDQVLARLQDVVEHDLGDDLALLLAEYCG